MYCNSIRLCHCGQDIMSECVVMLRYQFPVIVLVTRYKNDPRYNITKTWNSFSWIYFLSIKTYDELIIFIKTNFMMDDQIMFHTSWPCNQLWSDIFTNYKLKHLLFLWNTSIITYYLSYTWEFSRSVLFLCKAGLEQTDKHL